MPPKKTASKRARSPEAAAEAPVNVPSVPVTWSHSPADVKLWKRDEGLLYLNLHEGDAHTKKAEDAAKVVKVAGFDMDDTIVMSKTGKVFPEGRADWRFLVPSVGPKLQELHRDGYRVVIFTNQAGIGGKAWKEDKANEIRGKIVDIGNALSIPLSAWVAACEDKYRKPGTGMWDHFTAHLPYPVDYAKSFYCGDAAGRKTPTVAGRKKDFGCGDRKFAINTKLPFFTPEAFFLNKADDPKAEIDWDGPSPTDLTTIPTSYPLEVYAKPPTVLECVILIGFPGCGKSTFARRFFGSNPHYQIINRDTIQNMAKCVVAASSALASGKSVVIDNTNPNAADRKPFIEAAKRYNVTLRAIHFTASREFANHLNVMRDRLGISPRVSSIAYNIYKGKFEAPTAAEGFEEVISVPPCADFTGLPETVKKEFFQLT